MIRRLSLIAALASLAACGGIPKRSFQFKAIDNEEIEVPCLIVVDDEWPMENEEAMFTSTHRSVEIAFSKPRMNVLLIPTRIGDDGNCELPRPTDKGEFLQQDRTIEITDAPVHVFALRRNPKF